MDAWTIILMLGASAIWATMVIAVLYAARAHRAGSSTNARL
jgi:hypothetical protein